jgi:hypothetical protein
LPPHLLLLLPRIFVFFMPCLNLRSVLFFRLFSPYLLLFSQRYFVAYFASFFTAYFCIFMRAFFSPRFSLAGVDFWIGVLAGFNSLDFVGYCVGLG